MPLFAANQDIEDLHTMPGMMLAMGLIGLLVVVVLILSAAALVKYLRS
jgi:hypothetical protein